MDGGRNIVTKFISCKPYTVHLKSIHTLNELFSILLSHKQTSVYFIDPHNIVHYGKINKNGHTLFIK